MVETRELERLVSEIPSITKLRWNDPRISLWIAKVEQNLRKTFGEDSIYYTQFHDETHGPVIVSSGKPESAFQHDHKENMERCSLLLRSILKEIRTGTKTGKLRKKEQAGIPSKFYHVAFEYNEEGKSNIAMELDMNYDQFQERIVNPLKNGGNLFLEGKVIAVSKLKRTQVYVTQKSSTSYLPPSTEKYPLYRRWDDGVFQNGDDVTREYLGSVLIDVAGASASTIRQTEPIQWLDSLFARFHDIARRLRIRHNKRFTLDLADEYDVQDLLRALLSLRFDDVREEDPAPRYAGKSTRMDFVLKREKIVIETKMTRTGLGEKEISDQLIQDVARYKSHPDCKILACFIYDPAGRINNRAGLKADIEALSTDKMHVLVFVYP